MTPSGCWISLPAQVSQVPASFPSPWRCAPRVGSPARWHVGSLALFYLILTWLDKCQVYAFPPHTRITLTLFQIAPAADRIANTTVGGRGLSACIQNPVRVDHMLGHLFFFPSLSMVLWPRNDFACLVGVTDQILPRTPAQPPRISSLNSWPGNSTAKAGRDFHSMDESWMDGISPESPGCLWIPETKCLPT